MPPLECFQFAMYVRLGGNLDLSIDREHKQETTTPHDGVDPSLEIGCIEFLVWRFWSLKLISNAWRCVLSSYSPLGLGSVFLFSFASSGTGAKALASLHSRSLSSPPLNCTVWGAQLVFRFECWNNGFRGLCFVCLSSPFQLTPCFPQLLIRLLRFSVPVLLFFLIAVRQTDPLQISYIEMLFKLPILFILR